MTTRYQKTSEATYDTDLVSALACFGKLPPEREKTVLDTLNNEWEPGITVNDWTTKVAARLGIRWDN